MDPSGYVAIGENDDDICLPGSDCDPNPHSLEPWKYDEGYDPVTDTIPNWGEDQSEEWRVERAAKVWGWICLTGGWWGVGCPDPSDLIPWLLFKEGALLFNGDVIDTNKETFNNWSAEQAIVLLAYYLFNDSDGLTPTDLSVFTSFFNPNSGGEFGTLDYKELRSKVNEKFVHEDVEKILSSGIGPFVKDGKTITHWWTSKEKNPCPTCISVFTVTFPAGVPDYKTGGTFYFGYKP